MSTHTPSWRALGLAACLIAVVFWSGPLAAAPPVVVDVPPAVVPAPPVVVDVPPAVVPAPSPAADVPPAVVPAADAPALIARLAACEEIAPLFAPGAKPPTVERVGAGDVWHVVVSSSRRWLVSPGEECRSRRVGRADMRAVGELIPANPGKEKAYFLVAPDGCEGCAMVGAVRGKAETPLVARWLEDDGCGEGGKAEILHLFSGADTLALRCRESIGAGFRETLLLLDGDLNVLLRADVGIHELLTDDERAEGVCPAEPVGWLKVLTRGERPVIEVLTPDSEDMEDGRGTAQVWKQRWDPAKRAFGRVGEPRAVRFDMRAKCR